MDYFIDVIVPLSVANTFTYSVSEAEFNFIEKGMRVAVPFGKTSVYTGIVLNKHHQSPVLYQAKDIFTIIDEYPVVTDKQLQFWQ